MSNTDIWLNSNYISKWNSDPISGNPVRGEQVDLLLSLVADHYIPGSTILDIGSGSGLVEEQLFRRLPEALVVGIDYSPALMAMAEKRLADKEKQFVTVRHDLRDIECAKLPERDYQVAFSVQTIHNLPYQSQRKVMSWVYRLLSTPGFFFFMHKFAIPGAGLFSCHQSVWKKQNSAYSASMDGIRRFEGHPGFLEWEGD